MELSPVLPFVGGAFVAAALYALLYKNLVRNSVRWDAIMIASVATGIAVSLIVVG